MNISRISRRSALTASAIAIAVGALVPASAMAADAPAAPAPAAAAAAHKDATPSDVLASTPWKTTRALDQDGNRVALDDPAVANFVGWAYFDADGTYTMYNLDDSPKLQGDWTVTPDGSERWINAKDADGKVLFERTVPITQLDKNVFTYRVFPNPDNTAVYYDIVHTKTNHVEPGTDGRGPGANGNQGGNGEYHFNNGNAR
ncbi:DUF4822 domain-containing protein [Streptomyces sp. NPDC050418]|uniref:DUF4822 domain-containing protein n=1 Tax=Streptomyces sp. NPDC050418 TaxID=3365612 RepID=UPI0037A3E847